MTQCCARSVLSPPSLVHCCVTVTNRPQSMPFLFIKILTATKYVHLQCLFLYGVFHSFSTVLSEQLDLSSILGGK